MTPPRETDREMTPAEADRLRKVELWQASHEELCRGRHAVIAERFEEMESAIAVKLGRQDFQRLIYTLAIMAVIALSGHGAIVAEIVGKMLAP